MTQIVRIAVTLGLLLGPVHSVEAGGVSKLLGVDSSVDHAADRMQQLLDSARQAAFALEFQTNSDMSDRIKQLDAIVQGTLESIDALEKATSQDMDLIIDDASTRINAIETQTIADLDAAIDKAECSIDKTLNQHLQDSLGAFGRYLNTNSFVVSPPLLYPNERECSLLGCSPPSKTFKIDSIDFANTYTAVRSYMKGRLNSSRDDTPIASILRSYLIIANVAKRAGCLTNLKKEYREEAAPYMATIEMWERITGEPLAITH